MVKLYLFSAVFQTALGLFRVVACQKRHTLHWFIWDTFMPRLKLLSWAFFVSFAVHDAQGLCAQLWALEMCVHGQQTTNNKLLDEGEEWWCSFICFRSAKTSHGEPGCEFVANQLLKANHPPVGPHTLLSVELGRRIDPRGQLLSPARLQVTPSSVQPVGNHQKPLTRPWRQLSLLLPFSGMGTPASAPCFPQAPQAGTAWFV